MDQIDLETKFLVLKLSDDYFIVKAKVLRRALGYRIYNVVEVYSDFYDVDKISSAFQGEIVYYVHTSNTLEHAFAIAKEGFNGDIEYAERRLDKLEVYKERYLNGTNL